MECPKVVKRGRNFRLLTEEEQPELLDFLGKHLPLSLKFHQTLLTYMKDKVWEFYFYVPNEWPNVQICLHFPGMTLSPHGLVYESVGVFCPNDQLEQLYLLRDEDVLVDWSRPLYINFVHINIANKLVEFYKNTGNVDMVIVDVWACEDPLLLDQNEESEEESDPDVQVLPLKAEHAEGIYELYPANDIESHEVFLRLIKTLPAGGVFCKESLAAWMVQSYYGAMFSMQTKPEYRRKGYGTKLARYLTKRVAERGYNPFVVIRPENEASQSLYKKLGFRKLFQTVRMIFTPLSWQETENEASNILRENLENAVRQLNVEQRVIAALRGDEDSSVASIEVQEAEGEETIREGGSDSNEEAEVVVEEPEDESYARDEEVLEPIEEQEERIEVTEEKEDENEKQKDVVVVEETEGAPNVDDSNEGDGGTDVASNDD
ncbi:glutamic acid-rich protein-like isoform X2 [Vespula squamosa]|uniref:Glutamic acid-rich protein-like isoform X2 n=1 Tax=Vespula squamosa TaxID=30214 RepID=A0ABD2ANU1_VESSQ